MQRGKTDFPIGAGTALMQSDESIGSFLGFTREQKREILTHSLISGQQGALQRGDADAQWTK